MFNEGDGNWLLRSAMNRDRVLRLTRSEMEEVMLMVASPGGNVPAPVLVSRR
jgi:predicted Rdx family selenoprotein